MKKTIKTNNIKRLNCIRVLVSDELLHSLEDEAKKESRKLSPMLRRILEERYQTRGE